MTLLKAILGPPRKKPVAQHPRHPNSLVFLPGAKGGIKLRRVKKPPGNRWFYNNQFLYLLKWDGKKMVAYEPSEKIVLLPRQLYRALRWEPVVRLLAYKSAFLEKANLVLGVIMVAMMAFILFMIVSQ